MSCEQTYDNWVMGECDEAVVYIWLDDCIIAEATP